jgi:pimeloyl-ACP methyl ester carboxylesterase
VASDQADILRREAQAMGELAELHRDPVFYGRGVPRGDGRLVLVVPGLFGNDLYLQPIRSWLARLGYTPLRSTLSVNAGCPDRLRNQVEVSLRRQIARRPRPVALIGHSRGGMLAWALASRLQEQASHLVLLGSPAPAVVTMMRERRDTRLQMTSVATSQVADAGARALKLLDPDCTVPACECPYTEDLRRPLSEHTRTMSIHSRDDQIVSLDACRVPGSENHEVGGTHSGLVYNRAVYPLVAAFLASSAPAPSE